MKNLLITGMFFCGLICSAQCNFKINEVDQKKFTKNFNEYDQNTALYLGNLSELAYWESDQIQNMIKEINETYPQNPVKVDLVEDPKSDAQALLYCTKDFLIISFRGTQPSKLRDIITDLKFWNYANNPSQNETLANMPTGHGGFRKSLMNLIKDKNLFQRIDNLISENNPNADVKTFPIYTTGHSLGAALSQFFMECLYHEGYNFIGAYHFAPPLAVACTENNYMRTTFGDKVYDIINYKDFVPRAGRNGVAHFGKFYRICDDSLLYKEPSSYVKFNRGERRKIFEYHSLQNYLKSLRKPENNFAAIGKRSSPDHLFPCMGNNITLKNPCK